LRFDAERLKVSGAVIDFGQQLAVSQRASLSDYDNPLGVGFNPALEYPVNHAECVIRDSPNSDSEQRLSQSRQECQYLRIDLDEKVEEKDFVIASIGFTA
jgi:hypothetical protein